MELVKIEADQLSEAAKTLPSTFLNLAANSQPGGRGSGLLVTRDDIFKIKRYERLGLSLPDTEEELEQMLGVGKTGLKGLEPDDILVLYGTVYAHANSWSAIEQQIKLVNTNLGIFAQEFVTSGTRMLEALDKMDWLDPFETAIRDLTPEEIEGFGSELLSPADHKAKNKLQIILRRVRRSVGEQQRVVEEVQSRVGRFSDGLSKRLIPAVNAKIELARSHGLAGKIEGLDKDIKRLAVDIQAKREEYQQLVIYILAGFVAGGFGAAVMGAIFGADAEKVRAERNSLIEERDGKIAETRQKAPMIQAVGSLLGYLEHLELTLSDALSGAQNLRSLWDVLDAWMDNADTKLKSIKNRTSMAEFALELSLVLDPWKQIKQQSNELAVTFNRAINDWNSGAKI